MIESPSGLARPRSIALRVVATIVTVSTAVALSESYRGLYLWGLHHGLTGIWAAAFPAQIDVFIAVGELALFVALTDRWASRHRAWAWMVTAGGLAVSVAGNVGHVGTAQWTDRLTAAVPPVAAFIALTVGLGILKRVVELAHTDADPAASSGPAVDLDSVRHRAVLDHAESDAQRVRYAVEQIGRPEIGPVREWLTTYGRDVPESNIMSILRREAAKSSDPFPAVNGSNGHKLELETLNA